MKKLFFTTLCFFAFYIMQGQTTYSMINNTSVTTCSGVFTDSGGQFVNYGAQENLIMTFCSDSTEDMLSFEFTQFVLNGGVDFLYAYDGTDTSAPLIGTYSATNPGTIVSPTPGGCITFRFTSGLSPNTGWMATVSCITPIENNECTGATVLTVNPTSDCVDFSEVSFTGATPSAEAVCTGTNGGDVWYEFTATNPSHIITLSNFAVGNSSAQPYVVSLYNNNCEGNLGTPLYCSSSNGISAVGLTVGETYKVRVSLNSNAPILLSDVCDICITTPDVTQGNNECLVTTINFDFEQPEIDLGGWGMFNHNAVPGWRTTASDQMIEYWSTGFNGIPSYSGNQFIELNANLVSGVYQDYVAPEGTVFNYGFAHRGRLGTDTCQLLAGPPGGPYTAVTSVSTGTSGWSYNTGTYTVPIGQPVTRFIFESVSSVGGSTVGNFLDAISFTASTGIVTPSPVAANCGDPVVAIEAIGAGTWIPYDTNPSSTVIANPNSNTTTISGFTLSGEYYYEWSTPFCNSTIIINYAGGNVPAPIVTDVNYCVGDVAAVLSADILTDHTAVWYANETGGTPLAEAPTPNTSVAGTTIYYVSQLSNSGCESPRAAVTVTVTAMPVADILPDVTECGSYTLPALNTNNNYYTSTAGTGDMLAVGTEITADQTVYIYAQVTGTNCNDESSFSITIINTPVPAVNDVTYCEGAVAESLTAETLPDYTAIWYADETGDTPLAEAPTPDTSVIGITTYYVSQSETNGCESARVPLTVTVIALPVADVIGNQTACDSYILPTLSTNNNYYTGSGGTGDILSAGTEITANQTVYVYAQTPGSNCTDESSFEVTIVPTPVPGIVGGCIGAKYTLEVSLDENYTLDEVTIEWINPSGATVSTENVVDAEQEGDYTVIITPISGNGCTATLVQNVNSIACLIPRGISPNGDEMNDTFDLSGFNVNSISIFNRYGKEVFNYGTYTNQWYGQTNDGDELPTGTYFYSLELDRGESKTGWVYINREQ
ncbi:T9SS type B sorting domain-containing protein [Flavobacterium salilacus subsp. salilacus]|uniref:Ig-like domain-containing protein n=1 Tax=Flavobacterium TaxID=237 RepID=UPI0010756DEB|nr:MULTISPECIES: gliding motility-associated C-terminal domain-containing protein [Flavobacterium]KAF2515435.1 T9SS type B sorting domain-containing protein [Flavobacterium salilacus subsp. salilacus]MBE1615830.1 gliding motility-associated C-terminal domain-containing protein [Flavobacterium sp. SaA2.13]